MSATRRPRRDPATPRDTAAPRDTPAPRDTVATRGTVASRGTVVRDGALRLLPILGACALALPGFAPLFRDERYLVTGAMACAAGLLIAVQVHRRRWGVLRAAGLGLAATLLLGTAAITPAEARWGLVPTRSSLLTLLTAPVTAWMRVLGAEGPSGPAAGVLIVVWVPVLIATAVGGVLALRRRALAALAASLLVPAVAILLAPAQEVAAAGRGIGLGILCLVALVLTPRADRGSDSPAVAAPLPSTGSRPRTASAPARLPTSPASAPPTGLPAGVTRRAALGSAAVLGVAGGGAAALTRLRPAPGPRRAPRDELLPAWDPRQEPSPLSTLRGHRTRRAARPLLTVEGLLAGDRLRLAVMDRHDGQALLAAGGGEHPRRDGADSGAFLRHPWGAPLSRPAPSDRHLEITVHELRGPWLPLPTGRLGLLERTDRPGRAETAEQPVVNRRSDTLALPGGLRGGERYRVACRTEPADPARWRQAAAAPDHLPPPPPLPAAWRHAVPVLGPGRRGALDALTGLAAELAEARTPRPDGVTPGLPGHGMARLLAMTAGSVLDPGRGEEAPRGLDGDEEQLTVLLVLLARAAGIPARVVLGVLAPPSPPDRLVLHGADVTAWVELRLAGHGWIPLDVPAAPGRGTGEGR